MSPPGGRSRLVPVLGLVILIALNISAIAFGQDSDEWEVTVTNMTKGQPFSPPLWATHDSSADMWSVGEQASNGLAFIAEDANNTPLFGLLNSDKDHVYKARIALPPPEPPMPPPILPGMSRTFTVESSGDKNRLSIVWMLVRTNDAFSGLDGVELKEGTTEVGAYDAGTEMNNERAAFIPGPPFARMGVRDPDAQLIAPHKGIVDKGGDLNDFAWDAGKPVAKVEIKNK